MEPWYVLQVVWRFPSYITLQQRKEVVCQCDQIGRNIAIFGVGRIFFKNIAQNSLY
jgi:hypothetical protein